MWWVSDKKHIKLSTTGSVQVINPSGQRFFDCCRDDRWSNDSQGNVVKVAFLLQQLLTQGLRIGINIRTVSNESVFIERIQVLSCCYKCLKKNGNLVLTVWWYFLEVCRPCNQSNPSTCGDQERRGKSLQRFHLCPNYWIPSTREQTPKKNKKFILPITEEEKTGYISLTFNCFNWRQNETTFWGPLTLESMAALRSLSNFSLAAVWKTIVTLPLNICK